VGPQPHALVVPLDHPNFEAKLGPRNKKVSRSVNTATSPKVGLRLRNLGPPL
jgi:hypothetical protein